MKDKILKIMVVAGKPLFLDEWDEKNIRMGFACFCVLIDVSQAIYLGIRIIVNVEVLWQEFIYEELSEICYICG